MLDLSLFYVKEMLDCIYSERLLCKLRLINAALGDGSKINFQEVEKGMTYAKHYHEDQKRESGEPYYSHPFEVAYMVSDYLPRTDIIITALLHDTIEDTSLTRREIERAFGLEIASQVYDLTRIKENGIKISSGQMLEDLWKKKKYDLLMVKLMDRLHNMQTISAKSQEKIDKIVKETALSFLALAAQIEQLQIEDEIFKLCLKASPLSEKNDKSLWNDYSY